MIIFFDLDETLFDHATAEREGVLRFLEHFSDHFSHGRDEFVEIWDRIAERHIVRYWNQEISYLEQRRERIRELFRSHATPLPEEAIDDTYAIFLQHYEAGWQLFFDVLPCLDALRERHHLAVITNGNPDQQRRKLERLGILDRFDFMVASEEAGVCKPDPAIFHEACRRAGADPSECVYIGDRLDIDAVASAAAGFTGVWLNRKGREATEGSVHIIRELTELDDVLKAISS